MINKNKDCSLCANESHSGIPRFSLPVHNVSVCAGSSGAALLPCSVTARPGRPVLALWCLSRAGAAQQMGDATRMKLQTRPESHWTQVALVCPPPGVHTSAFPAPPGQRGWRKLWVPACSAHPLTLSHSAGITSKLSLHDSPGTSQSAAWLKWDVSVKCSTYPTPHYSSIPTTAWSPTEHHSCSTTAAGAAALWESCLMPKSPRQKAAEGVMSEEILLHFTFRFSKQGINGLTMTYFQSYFSADRKQPFWYEMIHLLSKQRVMRFFCNDADLEYRRMLWRARCE